MSARTIDRGGASIGYDVRGQGPALVLSHATLSSARHLGALAARLAERHTVISVDRRGHGASAAAAPEPPAPVDVAEHVEDILAILDREGAAAADLFGHSYGGCVALELAARVPSRVRSVYVFEPPYLPLLTPQRLGPMRDVGVRTLQVARRDGYRAAAIAFMTAVSGAQAVAALPPAARARVEAAGRGAVADATLAGLDPAGLERIEAPVRVAVGGASDLLYRDIAALLLARLGDADVTVLEALDHMAPVIRPDIIATSVEDFLAT